MRIDHRYGVVRRIKKFFLGGIKIHYNPTMRCNLDCKYCSEKFPIKYSSPEDFSINIVKKNECSTEKFNRIIDEIFDNVEVPVNEVVVSGGEPTLRKDISILINHVLDKGCFVTLFSNLATSAALNVKETYKFRIVSTFHSDYDNRERYLKMLERYKEKYFVVVEEIESAEIFHHRSKEKMHYSTYPIESICMKRMIISPEGGVFMSSRSFFEDFYDMDLGGNK
jgi:organic radical activating enzyme